MSRKPLLLLPGMMCDRRLFAAQLEGLGDLADSVVADIGEAETVGGIAEQVLEAAPWPRFALAGLSMGGIVAMEMLRRAPERIERLALLDTNHLAETPERQALRQPQIERALQGGLRRLLIEEMKPLYLAPQNRDDDSILDCVLDMALELGPEVFARQSAALRSRPDQTDTLRGARLPVLLLCGEADGLCPVERHREMAALLPRARLEILTGAGHLPSLEQPEETTAALRRWLSEEGAWPN